MSTSIFCQQIKFNRALGLYGDLYKDVKKPVVPRAVMVLKSAQSAMVEAGTPYVAFITANEAFHGDEYAHSHLFATPEDAVAFAEAQLATHPAIAR